MLNSSVFCYLFALEYLGHKPYWFFVFFFFFNHCIIFLKIAKQRQARLIGNVKQKIIGEENVS